MHGVAVGFGMNGHSGDAHLFTRAVNPQGNFAAIGNQNFFEKAGAAAITC